MTDPRAIAEIRVPAIDLRKGDVVNTTPGDEDDWQEVLGVYAKPEDARSTEIQTLVGSLGGRYVVVQFTNLTPVDGAVYFDDASAAMIYGDDEDGDDDQPVAEVVSTSNGVKTFLYTKYEVVNVRAGS